MQVMNKYKNIKREYNTKANYYKVKKGMKKNKKRI